MGRLSYGDRYVVCGSPGTLVSAHDILSWTQDSLGGSVANLYDIWVGFDGIYMVGTGGALGTDGVVVKYVAPADWSTMILGPGLTPRSITRSGNTFVVVGDSGLVFTSTNGTTWEDHGLGKIWGSLNKVRWAGHAGTFLAVGSAVMSSGDGVSWAQQSPKSTTLLRDISWTTLTVGSSTFALYCAVGDAGIVLTSEDRATWTLQHSGVTDNLYGIDRGLVPTRFVVVGENGVILTSE